MQGTITAFVMTNRKDILRINLIVPTLWEELTQEQLKYYYFVLTMCQSAAEVKNDVRWSAGQPGARAVAA